MTDSRPALPDAVSNYTGPITVLVSFRVKREKLSELERAVLRLIELSRGEAGVLQYHFHRDLTDARAYLFYETYCSFADYERHRLTAHSRAWKDTMDELVDGAVGLRWLRTFGS